MAVICASLPTVNCAAVPSKATAVAPVRPVPVSVTTVPTGPKAGETLVRVGAVAVVAPQVTEKLAPSEARVEVVASVALVDGSTMSICSQGALASREPLTVQAEKSTVPKSARGSTPLLSLGASAITSAEASLALLLDLANVFVTPVVWSVSVRVKLPAPPVTTEPRITSPGVIAMPLMVTLSAGYISYQA